MNREGAKELVTEKYTDVHELKLQFKGAFFGETIVVECGIIVVNNLF